MSSGSEHCQLAGLLHDLTAAEEYAYGRADWDAEAAEKNASIGAQLLRYCSYPIFSLSPLKLVN